MVLQMVQSFRVCLETIAIFYLFIHLLIYISVLDSGINSDIRKFIDDEKII